jgi:hypothetical protein
MRIQAPKFVVVRSAVLNAGYQISIAHSSEKGMKTNCPVEVLFDIIRCLGMKLETPMPKNQATLGYVLRSKPPVFIADFKVNPAAQKQRKGIFFPNPEPNWGPKSRAGHLTSGQGDVEGKTAATVGNDQSGAFEKYKSITNQNKRVRKRKQKEMLASTGAGGSSSSSSSNADKVLSAQERGVIHRQRNLEANAIKKKAKSNNIVQ